MPDNRTQECVIINKSNIDIIGRALEEYMSSAYHDAHTINEINEARIRVRKIEGQIEKINEVKICWG